MPYFWGAVIPKKTRPYGVGVRIVNVYMVASAYFLFGSILTRDSVHTDRDKVSTKASYYTDKHLKRRIKCYFALT